MVLIAIMNFLRRMMPGFPSRIQIGVIALVRFIEVITRFLYIIVADHIETMEEFSSRETGGSILG
jgi:hypothetical protein